MAQEKWVLIVDDDIELGTLLAKAVSDMSDAYQVRIARDVDEAMVQVRRSQSSGRGFDLVITDIKMSGLTGLELLEALRTIAPDTKTIAMTAYNSPEIARRARQLHVEAYLIKPFVISEFRQIVRDILSADAGPSEVKRERTEDRLSIEQKTAVSRELASLRAMTGATATLLLQNTGRVISVDTIEPALDLSQVCTALEATHRSMSEQMNLAFAQDCPVRQSYFGTDTYSVCTCRVNEFYAAAVVFGPAVKEGQVWYYLRETAQALDSILADAAATPQRQRTRTHDDVFDMLDRFFPNRAGSRDRKRAGTTAAHSQPSLPEYAASVSPEPSAAMDIDWEVSTDVEWDDIVEETPQEFAGLTLEQAREQGLVSPCWKEESASADQDVASLSPIEDIDWEVTADMDWDSIVEETDQGLKGISYDEAQQRGLIGDISEE